MFEIEMDVRDSECDIQGVVNNAVYQNYLEHARHLYLEAAGIDFAGLHAAGVDPMVTRAEIDYKRPLRPGDRFVVGVRVSRKGRLRFIFNQEIRSAGRRPVEGVASGAGGRGSGELPHGALPPGELVVTARIVAVTLSGGRPVEPTEIIEAIERRFGAVERE